MVETHPQGVFVDPQFFGYYRWVLRPGERLTEGPDGDESPRDRLLDCGLFAGSQHRLCRHRAAPDVLDFVSYGAAPLSLHQRLVESDGLIRPAGKAHDAGGQGRPYQGPISKGSKIAPRVMHASKNGDRV